MFWKVDNNFHYDFKELRSVPAGTKRKLADNFGA